MRARLQEAKETLEQMKAQGKTLTKVWRVKVFAKELMDCGFDPEKPDEFTRILRPLLQAKGLPARFLRDGVDCRIHEAEDGESFTLEFE
jgi:hypothetical protein